MLIALGFRPIKAATRGAGRQHRAGRVRRAGDRRSSRWPRSLGVSTTPASRHAGRHGRPADAAAGRRSCRWCWSSSSTAGAGVRQTWLPALAAGVAFGVAQFVASNYISVPLTDIVAALLAAGAVVCCCGSGGPPGRYVEDDADEPVAAAGSAAAERPPGDGDRSPGAAAPAPAATGRRRGRRHDRSGRRAAAAESDTAAAEVARAYAPYLIIIAVFSSPTSPGIKARSPRSRT